MRNTTKSVFSFLIAISILGMTCNAEQTDSYVNNKILSPSKAIRNGYIVMIYYDDRVSSGSRNNTEVYNSHRLDEFISNVNNGRKDMIHIVKYANSSKQTWVNKLCKLQYDGSKKVEIDYDVYSSPNVFIPLQPISFHSIKKYDYPDAIRYEVCFSREENNCALLISYAKNSITN